MDIRLTPEDLELRDRARSFTERVLIPLELECEEHDGLSAESSPICGSQGLCFLPAKVVRLSHPQRDRQRQPSATPMGDGERVFVTVHFTHSRNLTL